MKIWVVYLWEPYEAPCLHSYFVSEESAKQYFDSVYDKSSYQNKHWEIEEIETED